MITCETAQAGNRASKSRCRGQCRDNSSEQDAMTPVRRACATLLHFDLCSNLRSQSLSLSANDMEDTARALQTIWKIRSGPLEDTAQALQPCANTAPFLSFSIALPFALFPTWKTNSNSPATTGAMATWTSKLLIEHPCGRGNSAISDA